MPLVIIDFHTHIFSPKIEQDREEYITRDPLFAELYSNPKAKLTTADELVVDMDKNGIDISVVLNISWSVPELCAETNNYIMESVARYPRRLAGFGMISLDSPDNAIKEIERAVAAGIRGIGELRPDKSLLTAADKLEPIIQAIIEKKLILLVHASEPVGHVYPGKGGLTPEVLYPLIAHYPLLKLVCAHWGGGLPFYALMPEVKKAMANVYFDTAASPFLYNPRIYEQAAELAGADKILFGSDYPLLSPGRIVKEITGSRLSEESRDRILYRNAARLLNIDEGK
jgi:uncharacterized protein